MVRISGATWCAYHFFYHGDRDLVLKHFVRPAVATLLRDQFIDSFFFIRYPLGGPHVRLRLRLAPSSAGDSAGTEAALQRSAARFLERRPSRVPENESPPKHDHPTYPDNTLLPFPFDPETERYGGEEFLPHSLDFFAVSSVRVLELVDAHGDESAGRRLARALRLLLQQAWGFAATEEEFRSLLTYRLPAGPSVDWLCERADRVFEALRDDYRALFLHELETLAKAELTPTTPVHSASGFYAAAARRLSWAVRGATLSARGQIGGSQMHMTANRLGLSIGEEMYLGRILWRSYRDVVEAFPAAWHRLLDVLVASRETCGRCEAPLGELLVPLFRHFLLSHRAVSPTALQESRLSHANAMRIP